MTPSWITSFAFAVLIVTAPFTFVLKVLLQLPRPLALSHRRWPMWSNLALIVVLTVSVTVFIKREYFDADNTLADLAAQFMIAALAYVFGLVLMLRQFSGVYPEFIVTTGSSGLALRKTRYRNIHKIERVSEHAGETRLRIETSRGAEASMTLPTRYVSILYDQMRKKLQDG